LIPQSFQLRFPSPLSHTFFMCSYHYSHFFPVLSIFLSFHFLTLELPHAQISCKSHTLICLKSFLPRFNSCLRHECSLLVAFVIHSCFFLLSILLLFISRSEFLLLFAIPSLLSLFLPGFRFRDRRSCLILSFVFIVSIVLNSFLVRFLLPYAFCVWVSTFSHSPVLSGENAFLQFFLSFRFRVFLRSQTVTHFCSLLIFSFLLLAHSFQLLETW